MTAGDVRERARRGFSLVELLVTVAIIGIAAVIALPSLLGYLRASTLTAGAQQLQSTLSSARQLAIRQNTSVCIERAGARVRFFTNTTCTGTPWAGAGTDGDGWIALANGVEISAAPGAPIVFSFMGAATPAGTYTLRNPSYAAQTLTVTVAASGRVTIP